MLTRKNDPPGLHGSFFFKESKLAAFRQMVFSYHALIFGICVFHGPTALMSLQDPRHPLSDPPPLLRNRAK